MARGDILRLTLSGKDVASDATWVPGALASEFPVDVVSITRPVGTEMQAVVRVRSIEPVSFDGHTIRAAGTFAVPGVEMPQAAVTKAELIGHDTSNGGAAPPPAWLTDEMKWVGAVALIAVTALLSSRIKKQP